MKVDTLRRFALSLPEVSEQPHHGMPSFRVRGRIFITLPPGDAEAHLFVAEPERELALAMHPDLVGKLPWGGKVVGLRVALAAAPAPVVKALVRRAWEHRAPKALVAALGRAGA